MFRRTKEKQEVKDAGSEFRNQYAWAFQKNIV